MRHLLIFLACCSLAFGVYVSPAEDTVHFVGHNQGWTEGATLVTNGTFTTDFTGWTEHTAVGVTIDTNTCKFTDAGGGGNFYIGQDIVNTVGKVYRLSYDVTANTGVAEGEFVLPATCLFGAKADLGITNGTTYVYHLLATNAAPTYDIRLELAAAGAGDTISIDNLTVQLWYSHTLAGGGIAMADNANFIDADGEIDLTKVMGTSGELLLTESGASVTDDGATVTIGTTADPDAYADGLLVNVDFSGSDDFDGSYVCTFGTNSITFADPTITGTETGGTATVYVGGAWPSITSAQDDDSTLCASGAAFYNRTFLCNEGEVNPSGVILSSGGSAAASVYRSFVGFHTACYVDVLDGDTLGVIVSDEDAGQIKHIMTTDGHAYGAMAMLRNDEFNVDVNGAYYQEIDADGAAVDVITVGGDNIELRNFKIHNNSKASSYACIGADSSNNNNLSFVDCWFDTAYQPIDEVNVGDDAAWISFTSCYFGKDMVTLTLDDAFGGRYLACTFNADLLTGFEHGSGSTINQCFFYSGNYGMIIFDFLSVYNCVFYGQTTACIIGNSAADAVLSNNNIFMPLATADYAIYCNTAGGTINQSSTNNLAWSVAGAKLTTPFYNALTASPSEIFLPNTIEADPQFVDVTTGDFRLKSNSPALKAGFKDFFGKSTNIGVNNEPRSRSDWVWR